MINQQNLNSTQDPGHDGSNGIPVDKFGEVIGYEISGHIGAAQEAGKGNIFTFSVYNYRNLPLGVTTTNGTFNYSYDDQGNRIIKQSSLSTKFYVNDHLGRTLAIYDLAQSTHPILTANIYGNGLIGRVDFGPTGYQKFYYLTDHLGNIRQTWDDSGVRAAQDYYSYGDILRSYNAGDTYENYKYTSKERDAESNLDYFGARYYDSWRGQWGQVDPLADKYPGWSSYNYVMDNPITFFDVNGDTVNFLNDELKAQHEQYYNEKDKDGNYLNTIYRQQFNELNSSEVVYNVVIGDLGGVNNATEKLCDFSTTDGKTVTITIDSKHGATIGETLSHEFVHGQQFEKGLIYFGRNNTTEAWGTVGITLQLEDQAFRNQQIPTILSSEKLNQLYHYLIGKKEIGIQMSWDNKRHIYSPSSSLYFGILQPKN